MATCKRFEDLPVWKAAVDLGVNVFAFTDDPAFDHQSELRHQLRRSALAVSNNIAEGCERRSTSELVRSLERACGAAGEVRSMLAFAERMGGLAFGDPVRGTTPHEELQLQVSLLKARAEACSQELLAWLESLRDAHSVIRHADSSGAHHVFIPGEHVRAFIAKLEKFRAGADPRDVFGPN
jgi:four helix bundle protein